MNEDLTKLLVEVARRLEEADEEMSKPVLPHETRTGEVVFPTGFILGFQSLITVVQAWGLFLEDRQNPQDARHEMLLEMLHEALQELDTADVMEALCDLIQYHHDKDGKNP